MFLIIASFFKNLHLFLIHSFIFTGSKQTFIIMLDSLVVETWEAKVKEGCQASWDVKRKVRRASWWDKILIDENFPPTCQHYVVQFITTRQFADEDRAKNSPSSSLLHSCRSSFYLLHQLTLSFTLTATNVNRVGWTSDNITYCFDDDKDHAAIRVFVKSLFYFICAFIKRYHNENSPVKHLF